MTDHENMLSTPEELLAKPCDQWCELEVLSAYYAIRELVAERDAHAKEARNHCSVAEDMALSANEQLDRAEKAEANYAEAYKMYLEALGGSHRTHERLSSCQADLAATRAGLRAVQDLIDDSYGVAGLHLNGDVAPWSDLLVGGRYEEWLVLFSDAIAAARAEGGE